jgi:hypothetical protein
MSHIPYYNPEDVKDNNNEVTRVVVIDELGRSYENCNVQKIRIELQDDNRTLKIFIEEKDV